MSAWQIYLIGQASSIRECLIVLFVSGGLALGFFAIGLVVTEQKFPRLWYVGLFAALLSLSLAAFFPSSKTLAAMYVIPPIVNNEQVKADAGEIYKLAVEFAKDKLQTEGEKK